MFSLACPQNSCYSGGMTENVINFPRQEGAFETLAGPQRLGNSLVVEGHCVPRMHVHDRGDTIEFVLDERMAFEFPKEWAYLAAAFASNAMAIGAGYPSLGGKQTEHFAPKVFQVSLDDKP